MFGLPAEAVLLLLPVPLLVIGVAIGALAVYGWLRHRSDT